MHKLFLIIYQQKNHLSGLTKTYLKVSFLTVQSLLAVRSELLPLITKNKERLDINEAYEDPFLQGSFNGQEQSQGTVRAAASDFIVDIREYDIPYYTRVSIDLGIRVGLWYNVTVEVDDVRLEERKDLVGRPDARVLAFDIETTKLPLKFPDPTIDSIMMISYMLDGQGFLIINRSVVSENIEDFEYTPKPDYEGKFTVFNEPDEKNTLEKFFSHIQKAKPNIIVTYNGDFFDWPFVEARAKAHGMNFSAVSGVREDQGEYKGHFVSHLDAFSWVRRDSYLPQGSQGLKAVTRNKLGYDPLELDPEDMCRFASEQPQTLASYSVSDAVATYYLYMTYIHPFIFSLCTIIPMNPHDVLRKGSGTLCESLLMAQAFKANIVFPNKHAQDPLKMYEGHLLESETYVGGHVESLESGIFRDDIEYKFATSASVYEALIGDVDRVLDFALEEGKLPHSAITNYDEVKASIVEKLEKFRVDGVIKETPAVYHVDVAAMYPNIILTNRLQPSAIVSQDTCASCDFNKPENRWYSSHIPSCVFLTLYSQRMLDWEWRGDYVPANSSEFRFVKEQLEAESIFISCLSG